MREKQGNRDRRQMRDKDRWKRWRELILWEEEEVKN